MCGGGLKDFSIQIAPQRVIYSIDAKGGFKLQAIDWSSPKKFVVVTKMQ